MTQVDYPLFLSLPISQIEDYIESFPSEEALFNFPVDSLPAAIARAFNKLDLDIQAMSVVTTKNQLKSCTERLRLKLHKFLDSISQAR
jgi:hypothetical protein